MMITDGKIVIGNDGGVYSRPLSDDAEDGNWTDLNATLHDLQFYDARAGKFGGRRDRPSGAACRTTARGGQQQRTQAAEAAGGDGFDVIVDPANANNWVGEYTDGAMYYHHRRRPLVQRLRQLHLRGQAIVGHGAGELRPEPPVRHAARSWTSRTPNLDGRRRGRVGLHSGWNTSCATQRPVTGRRCTTPGAATRSRRCRQPATARSSTPPGSVAAETPARHSPRASPPTTAAPGTR